MIIITPGYSLFFIHYSLSRNGVITGTSPGMTTEDAFDSKPTSLEDSVFENRFDHVLAASRRVPAGRRCQRRYENPVKIDRQEEELTNKEPTPPLPIGREI